MSFAYTWPQILDRSKIVTRRIGWRHAKPGEHVQPVKQAMGLKRGEEVVRAPHCIVLVDLRKEPLRKLIDLPAYGVAECIAEGFPDLSPKQFVDMFCDTHRGCEPSTNVTRIAFRYEVSDAH
jgi:hypothetical protein